MCSGSNKSGDLPKWRARLAGDTKLGCDERDYAPARRRSFVAEALSWGNSNPFARWRCCKHHSVLSQRSSSGSRNDGPCYKETDLAAQTTVERLRPMTIVPPTELPVSLRRPDAARLVSRDGRCRAASRRFPPTSVTPACATLICTSRPVRS
jgi:hypothetical protein